MTIPDVEIADVVTRTEGISGGKTRIRNTRHTVAGLAVWRNLGLLDAEILERHPDLSETDLIAAWNYLAQHREEIADAIQADEGA